MYARVYEKKLYTLRSVMDTSTKYTLKSHIDATVPDTKGERST